jgi:hypothetical protein
MSWDGYRDRLLDCRIERDRPGEVCGDMAPVDLYDPRFRRESAALIAAEAAPTGAWPSLPSPYLWERLPPRIRGGDRD